MGTDNHESVGTILRKHEQRAYHRWDSARSFWCRWRSKSFGNSLYKYGVFVTPAQENKINSSSGSTSPMPGLWLFLLIVVAILLFVVGVTSLAMHFIQYRYRQNLRRRVANGEVDLEALGVKRLTVPKEILDKFPISVYIANPPTPSQPPMPTDALNQTNSTSGVTPIGGITNAPGNTAINRGFYQPSCPVCPHSLFIRTVNTILIHYADLLRGLCTSRNYGMPDHFCFTDGC